MDSLRLRRREDLERAQLVRLKALLAALIPANPFQTARLRAAGIDGDPSSLEEFKRTMPFTVKRELVEDQRFHSPYGSNLTYPLESYTRLCQTSATSGNAQLRWLDTRESWDWMLNCWRRILEIAGVTPLDRAFFASSFAPFLGFWTAFEAASILGCMCIPGGGLSTRARLRMILDNEVTLLCCTPTYALRMAEVALDEGIDLGASRVERILVAGEPGGSVPGVRARIESLWGGARVLDHHGMTEIGPVSYACPRVRDTLHILESDYIPEVVDPQTGASVAPGETGELVLTNLGRAGSPLLRYRTGDMVRLSPHQPCECGSWELGLEGGILSRTDDMVIVRGVNLYPAAVEEIVRACNGIGEYRVEIDTRRALVEMRLRVEPLPTCAEPDGLARKLEAMMDKAFGLRIPVSVVPVGELPRFEMKARRWVRL
jgi:phenylacetate-CoA ligase